MTRICARCKVEQSLNNFGVKTKKNGKVVLQPYCKECIYTIKKTRKNKNTS